MRAVIILIVSSLLVAVAGPAVSDDQSAAGPGIDVHFMPSRARLRAMLRIPEGPPASQEPSLVAALAVSGTNVLLNSPALDTTGRTTQNETTLAVHGTTVCAGYNNTSGLPASISGFSRSPDRGTTWNTQGFAGPLHFGDPALAVHKASGTFYYGDLVFLGDRSPSGNLRSVIGVVGSTDDCRSFSGFANATPNVGAAAFCAAPSTSECRACTTNADCASRPDLNDGVCTARDAEDKPWIAVDNSGGLRDGTVYACWTRFVDEFVRFATRGEIRFSRSIDGGVTFIDEQAISPSTDEFPIGCHIDVGSSGDVNVAWSDRSVANQFPIRFRRSLNGGLSWEPTVQVNTVPIRPPGTDRPVQCGTVTVCNMPFPVMLPTLNGDIRMAPQAWLAVDATGGPFNGSLYAAWAADPPGMDDNSDVFFSRSTDGGHTWSPEIQLGGDSRSDQFEPFIAIGGSGTVSVAWYDRRNDLTNNLIDVYTAFARDGGITFDPIVRVTDVSFPVPPLTGQPTATGNFDPSTSACYMGEYIAVAADTTSFYYAWGDNRNQVVSSAYPSGRPDPDVFFERRPAPPIVCIGDCNASGEVTVDKLLTLVNIALGNIPVNHCSAGDTNRDGNITIDEILAAVINALNGCPT